MISKSKKKRVYKYSFGFIMIYILHTFLIMTDIQYFIIDLLSLFQHYKILEKRLRELGSHFGALPVHNGKLNQILC